MPGASFDKGRNDGTDASADFSVYLLSSFSFPSIPSAAPPTVASVSRAMVISSSVGITRTVTGLPSGEITGP